MKGGSLWTVHIDCMLSENVQLKKVLINCFPLMSYTYLLALIELFSFLSWRSVHIVSIFGSPILASLQEADCFSYRSDVRVNWYKPQGTKSSINNIREFANSNEARTPNSCFYSVALYHQIRHLSFWYISCPSVFTSLQYPWFNFHIYFSKVFYIVLVILLINLLSWCCNFKYFFLSVSKVTSYFFVFSYNCMILSPSTQMSETPRLDPEQLHELIEHCVTSLSHVSMSRSTLQSESRASFADTNSVVSHDQDGGESTPRFVLLPYWTSF